MAEQAAATPIDTADLHGLIARRLAEAIGGDRAEAVRTGAISARALEAVEHRDQVLRLSREGRTVREIAASAGLSKSHVVTIRAQLGIGRKR